MIIHVVRDSASSVGFAYPDICAGFSQRASRARSATEIVASSATKPLSSKIEGQPALEEAFALRLGRAASCLLPET